MTRVAEKEGVGGMGVGVELRDTTFLRRPALSSTPVTTTATAAVAGIYIYIYIYICKFVYIYIYLYMVEKEGGPRFHYEHALARTDALQVEALTVLQTQKMRARNE
jgi:hypothetical protein